MLETNFEVHMKHLTCFWKTQKDGKYSLSYTGARCLSIKTEVVGFCLNLFLMIFLRVSLGSSLFQVPDRNSGKATSEVWAPMPAFPLFRSSPLTESLEQAELVPVQYRKWYIKRHLTFSQVFAVSKGFFLRLLSFLARNCTLASRLIMW